MKADCPRRPERPFEYLNKPDDGTCDYCGSLDADVFMARLEAGDVTLDPTDKNYKVYVHNNGGAPFKQTHRIDTPEGRRKNAAVCAARIQQDPACEMSDADRDDAKRYAAGEELDPMDQRHWKWTTREVQEVKFYFEHLNEEQKKRFVELLNAKKITLNYPGYFYRTPFFIRYGEPTPAA